MNLKGLELQTVCTASSVLFPYRAMAAACKLRLVQFCEVGGGRRRVGVEQRNGGSVVDITAVNPSIPTDMKSFLCGWDTNIQAAAK